MLRAGCTEYKVHTATFQFQITRRDCGITVVFIMKCGTGRVLARELVAHVHVKLNLSMNIEFGLNDSSS